MKPYSNLALISLTQIDQLELISDQLIKTNGGTGRISVKDVFKNLLFVFRKIPVPPFLPYK